MRPGRKACSNFATAEDQSQHANDDNTDCDQNVAHSLQFIQTVRCDDFVLLRIAEYPSF